MKTAAQRLVALLLTTGEAVQKRELERQLGMTGERLAAALADARTGLTESGLTLVETEQGVELTTSPAVADWLRGIWAETEPELTRAAAETLALVAYAGPLTRFEVDSLRGVDSRRILRGLWRAGLLQRLPGGRAAQYGVTEEFLKGAGVSRREELPRFAELSTHRGIRRLLGREEL